MLEKLFLLLLLMLVSCTPASKGTTDPCNDARYLRLKSQTSFTHEDSALFASLDQACIKYTADNAETTGRSGNTVLLVFYSIVSVAATIALFSLFSSLGKH